MSGGGPEPIVGDDQLYDWGIENSSYPQYFPESIEGQTGGPPPQGLPQQGNYPEHHHPCYGGDGPVRSRQDGYNLPEHVVPTGSAINIVGTISSGLMKSERDLKQRYHPTPILPNGPTPSPGPCGGGGTGGGRRPMIPQFDMDANEILKMERKRARNRLAASKCRMRKIERITVLDHQANQLRADNDELRNVAEKLKAEVYALKQELKWHVNNGCKVWRNNYDNFERRTDVTQLCDADEIVTQPKNDVTPKKKCEVASPDSTTSHNLLYPGRVKREICEEENQQLYYQQQQQQLQQQSQQSTVLPNNL